MGITTITYNAKCKDCRFHISYPRGKVKRHYCGNSKSPNSGLDVALKQLVCFVWEIA